MSRESRLKWQRWPAELRRSALERMKRGESVGSLVKEFGAARSLLNWWKQRADERLAPMGCGAGADSTAPGMRELEKKVAELERVIARRVIDD